MYTHCIFCKADLGRNEAIEEFPVGRRLAFDEAKGRLWAVCGSCRGWNLTPLEERWEAVEACERAFRKTMVRYSTDHIGLARHAEGLDLVRIGEPLRPEFAAWRYGDRFTGRRWRSIAASAGLIGFVGVVAGPGAGLVAGGAGTAALYAFNLYTLYRTHFRTVLCVPSHDENGDEDSVALTDRHVQKARLARDEGGEGWALRIPRRLDPSEWLEAARSSWALDGGRPTPDIRLTGADALRAAGLVLPRINRRGGRKREVQHAVRLLEGAGRPDNYFRLALDVEPERVLGADRLAALPVAARLALEMAAHEESERRALEGELWLLERSWREAEDIAAIADDLLIPRSVRRFIQRHRDRPLSSG